MPFVSESFGDSVSPGTNLTSLGKWLALSQQHLAAGETWAVDPNIHRCPIDAIGTIGSRHCWLEAPYLDCPSTPAAAISFTSFPLRENVAIHIIPGLLMP